VTSQPGLRPESERYEAARRLAALAPPDLFAAARECLADPEWRVRRAAWEALLAAPAGDDERFAFLIECLEDTENAGTRGAALEALIYLGAAAVPRIVGALDVRDDRGKRYLLDALAQIRSPLAAPAARALVDYADENVGFAAAEVLGLSGAAEDARFLLAKVPGASATRRFALLAASVQIARRNALSVETALVAPWLGDALLRAPAVELLGVAGGEGAAESLWSLVAPGKPVDGILLALRCLAKRGHTTALPESDYDRFAAVMARCRHPGTPAEVRRAAFEVFLHGSPANVGPLLPILAQSDGEWLVDALSGVEDHRLREWLPLVMLSEPGRVVAARTYARRPELQGESSLLALLNQPGLHRHDVLAALAAVGSLRAVPHLISLCADEDGDLADRAGEALVTLVQRGVAGLELMVLNACAGARAEPLVRLLPTVGLLSKSSAAARDRLVLAMRDADAAVRKAATLAAAEAPRESEAVQALVARLADEDEEVRSAAAATVAALGFTDLTGALDVLLDDPSPWVQSTALAALARLGAAPVAARLAALLQRGGVVAVAAAHVAGDQPGETTFALLAPLLPRLDDDAAAELLKALTGYPSELPREILAALRDHPAWNVRAAVAQYLLQKRPAWAAALAREWLATEPDELVRLRLEELAGTAP
jgi:HEAT repeat protein